MITENVLHFQANRKAGEGVKAVIHLAWPQPTPAASKLAALSTHPFQDEG